jgi:lipoate-protein ligase A
MPKPLMSEPLMRTGRRIPMERLSAATNMAADQAMLESVDAGGDPALRFYQWQSPTLSLGYFQSLADRDDHVESRDAVCVRRSSGGGAIMHHHELTYAIAWPIDPAVRGQNLVLYRQVRDAIVGALASFGVDAVPFSQTPASRMTRLGGSHSGRDGSALVGEPFLCFQRRTADDLIVGGYKVLGSAQRKGKRAVLQHGSLLLAASPLAPQLPGLRELGLPVVDDYAVESPPAVVRIAARLAESLSAILAVHWDSSDWTDHERSRQQFWVASRFANPKWSGRR